MLSEPGTKKGPPAQTAWCQKCRRPGRCLPQPKHAPASWPAYQALPYPLPPIPLKGHQPAWHDRCAATTADIARRRPGHTPLCRRLIPLLGLGGLGLRSGLERLTRAVGPRNSIKHQASNIKHQLTVVASTIIQHHQQTTSIIQHHQQTVAELPQAQAPQAASGSQAPRPCSRPQHIKPTLLHALLPWRSFCAASSGARTLR
ncbi:hypothetical protein V8C86DRAFT_823936 [Haematococcus lacustris]